MGEAPAPTVVAAVIRSMTLGEALRYAANINLHSRSPGPVSPRLRPRRASPGLSGLPRSEPRCRRSRDHEQQHGLVLFGRARSRFLASAARRSAARGPFTRTRRRFWRRWSRTGGLRLRTNCRARRRWPTSATKPEQYRAGAERLRIGVARQGCLFRASTAPARPARGGGRLRARTVPPRHGCGGGQSGLHAPIELTRAEADLTKFDVGRIRARWQSDHRAGGVRGRGRPRRVECSTRPVSRLRCPRLPPSMAD